MRILPYRTYENRIDGVVITLSDITVAKRLEQAAQRRIETLEAALAAKQEDAR